MPKPATKIAGMVLIALGVITAILHYVLESSIINSWISFAIAAVLLFAGVALYERGKDRSSQQGPGDF